MDAIKNICSLLYGCVADAAENSGQLTLVLLIAAVVAGGFWAGCYYSMQLWNRKFRMRTFHHAVCCCAGLIGLLFIVLFHSLQHLETVAADVVDQWADALIKDKSWVDQELNLILYNEIDEVDPQNTPEKNLQRRVQYTGGDNIIIDTYKRQEDIEIIARVTSREVISRFRSEQPFLSRILWPAEEDAASAAEPTIQEEIHYHFDKLHTFYPNSKAVIAVANVVKTDLSDKLPRVSYLARSALVIAFFLLQAIAFGIVGFTGYRALKVQVAAELLHR